MMQSGNKYYPQIREYLDTIPVIETHEHYLGIIEPVDNIFSFLTEIYYSSDFKAVSPQAEKAFDKITDSSIPLDERYKLFDIFRRKSCHTAYYRAILDGLKACWNIDGLDLKAIKKLEENFRKRDQKFFGETMERHNIRGIIANIDIFPYLDDPAKEYDPRFRLAFPLPDFHDIHRKGDLTKVEKYLDRKIYTLDDYLEGFEIILQKSIDRGVVCLKDQTAYRRIISYDNPPRSEAEKIFNRIISNPRDVYGDSEVKVLDDWLFHYFMRLAGKYELPVQIHTGHMAGIRNEISKTNAVHLIPIFELYTDVRFDLFHGNWPYMGELLFLGKNYPNVNIDMCWVHCIDPHYSVELMKRALLTVPHSKIMAFGGDTFQPEWAVGFLVQAKDNTACALSEMVDSGWISIKDAKSVALDWFFNNPNQLFKLGINK